MKKVLSVILFFALVMSLAGCSSKPGEISSEDNTPSALEPGVVGDTLDVNDVSIMLLSVEETEGNILHSPSEGNVYVIAEFEVINNSSEDAIVSYFMCFAGYMNGEYVPVHFDAGNTAEGHVLLDGTLAPNEKMVGVVGFELPEDWTEIEIVFTLDVFGDVSPTFICTKP